MPGFTQSRIAHSSDRRFSTGVPVRAMRCPARSLRTARADRVAGFLTNCASSSTTVDQATSARTSRSRVSRPYVVTTRSLAARTDAGSPPVSPLAPCRWAPWWTVTVIEGVKRRALRLPVVDDRERADDEVWPGSVDEVGERRRRLAEAHVVGEAAAEAEAVEEPQPAEAAALVRPQLTGERR